MKRRRVEGQLQAAVFQHLAVRATTGTFAFHCPNGGARSPIEAKILKGQGVVPGVPDVIAIRQGEVFAVELKAPGGRLSPAQLECHARLQAAGAKVATAAGIDEAIEQLEQWNLLRGRRT
jgi:VRR-NUC domain